MTLTATAGGITLDATSGQMVSAGSLNLNATGGVTINDTLVAGGLTTIDADSDAAGDDGDLNVADGATLGGVAEALDVTANDVDLNTTGMLLGTAVSITDSDGDGIGVGTVVVGDLNLSGAELQQITASTGLTLITAGDIAVDGVTAANSDTVNLVTLDSAQGISFDTTASTFDSLDAQADDGIALNVDVSSDEGPLSFDGDADNAVDTTDDIAIADTVFRRTVSSGRVNNFSSESTHAGGRLPCRPITSSRVVRISSGVFKSINAS